MLTPERIKELSDRHLRVVGAGYVRPQDAEEFARAVLAKWGTPPAVAGEPVAWRYVDARGHFRYVGYKPSRDMAAEYPLLKPIRIYLHPSPPEGMAVTDAMIDAGKKMLHNSNGRGAREKVERIFNAMIALAAPPTAQAEGWRLVPVEPTTDQEWAGKQAALRGSTMAEACKIYKAMLAAAPTPPTSAEGVEHG